jgi:protein subunit release factor B
MSKPIKPDEVKVTHVRGSGPGGQNRNKRMSGVRVIHEPTGIKVEATERRSQAQNLKAALERLEDRVERHFFRPKARKATKKTRASQERRVKAKNRRGSLKKMRGRVRDDG